MMGLRLTTTVACLSSMMAVGLRSTMACSTLEMKIVVSSRVGVEDGYSVLAVDGCVLWVSVEDGGRVL
jgi:hypothetical protein